MGNYPRFFAKDASNYVDLSKVVRPLEIEVAELRAIIKYIKEMMASRGIVDHGESE